MRVLSLFDGMSCCQLALRKLGIAVEKYYASEIDKPAMTVTNHNFPNTIQLGDVTKWEDWGIDWKSIDLVTAGFPCCSWSVAGKQLGDKDPRGMLFWTTLDIMKKVLASNPNAKFLLENVKMKKEFEQYITHHTEQALGKVEKILINSALVSAQNRNRYYWHNIPNVTQPEDKGITWGDVRERGVNGESYYYTEKAMQWLARHSQRKDKVLKIHQDDEKMQMLEASHAKSYSSQRFFGICDLPSDTQAVASMRGRFLVDGKRQDGKMKTEGLTTQYVEFRYDGKTNNLSTIGKDNIVVPFTLPGRIPVDEFFFRYITPEECEALQTVDRGYTSCVSKTQRLRILGNGWTVDVIAHIFKGLR
jgi:DNA (cytosine-5)-methyltransferase 1/DNA (cytosine-5)-methyltransferase 3A